MSQLLKHLFNRLKMTGFRILPWQKTHDPDNHEDAFQVQKTLLPEAKIIIDAGAHEGLVTRQYTHLFPDANIFALEPYRPSYAKLVDNFVDNPNVIARNLAIADRPGQGKLNVNSSVLTNSLLDTDQKGGFYWREGLLETQNTEVVDIDTLDEFCQRENIETIDILKLDIQGKEHAALVGAETLLSQQRISLIYCEVILVKTYKSQNHFHQLLQLAETFNYSLFGIYNPCYKQLRLNQIDIILLSEEAMYRYENSLLE